MSYRTILVLTDTSTASDDRIACACRLAGEYGAHLAAIAASGIYRLVYGSFDPRGELGDMAPVFADLRARAAARAERFDQLARQAGLASFAHRIVDDEPGYALATGAIYADLAIVCQTDPDQLDTTSRGIPEYAALHAPCPVLVLPYAGRCRADFRRVLVAWNASPESARAVRQALPFLTRAADVEVAIIGGGLDAAALGGRELAVFLARHGIKASLWQSPAPDAGEALLSRAAEIDADMLVMGCYGHTRLREVILGGASRTVLRSMTLPVLMAH